MQGDEQEIETAQPSPSSRRVRRALVGLAIAVGATIAGTSLVQAQTPTPTPSQSEETTPAPGGTAPHNCPNRAPAGSSTSAT